MTRKNVYEQCPEYETGSFILRLVRFEDAPDLLSCYADREVAEKANADFCTSEFWLTSLDQMTSCIEFWLSEYSSGRFVRYAIVPKNDGRAAGTLEIFGGDNGVLRIDLARAYEREECLSELLELTVLHLIYDFGVKRLRVKVMNTPERLPLLKRFGFVPSETFHPNLGYYERVAHSCFDSGKSVAYCGLACCACSENADCSGCRMGGCTEHEWCKNYKCCREKGLDGCWQCEQFPCDSKMFASARTRAFVGFIAKHGEEKLIRLLEQNQREGSIYHYYGALVGDYDLTASEEGTLELLTRNEKEKGL